MDVTDLLGYNSTAWNKYSKTLAREIGLHEAILFNELRTEAESWREKNKLTEDGYFYETVEKIKENTTLTHNQQRNTLKNLEKLNLITTKRKGVPAMKYFKINEDELYKALFNKGVI